MAGWLIVLVAIIYLGVAIDLGLKGNWPMCLVFACYALGNIGLYLSLE